ncbi:hypothetical protein ACIQCM_08805 [Pseudarthrobacter sp. NPDC092439]|uniref:hypothetical protein n=1 Tax=unclassified Pseudarthrobacter TaxID=2647000 RepID=UPI00382BCBE8
MSQPIALENLSWREEAKHALEAEAATGRAFDAYDLQERHNLTAPASTQEWGSLFRVAAQRGLIQSIGFHVSRRPSRSGGVCRIWIGTKPRQKSGLDTSAKKSVQTATASNTKN